MKNKALAAPYLVWMALFTIVPLAIVAYYAFTDAATGEFTFANIANLGNYMPILIKSIWLALISSLICIVIGYPVAYFIANCKETTQRFLYMLVMLPMCISFLLRTLAWVALTEDTGIINNFITAIGLQPLPLIRNNGAVVLGMVYNYLPYMIMPLYTVIMKIDRRLIEAAQDLGCNSVNVFKRYPAAIGARNNLGLYDGVRSGGIDVLHFPEARLLRNDAHRRRYREPVQDRLQPEPRRCSESYTHGDDIHLHRGHEPLRR